MLQHLREFVDASKTVDTLDGLGDLFLEHVESLDIAYFTCVNIFGTGGLYQPHQYFGRFNDDWLKHYMGNHYFKEDPTFLHGLHNDEAFGFREIAAHPDLPKISKQVMTESQDFDMKDGLVITLKGINGELSYFTMAGPTYERDWEKDAVLEMMAQSSFRRATQIKAIESKSEELGLTTQQLRVMSKVADGMTDADIALALEISPKTANHHVEEAKSRTGSINRTHAAVQLLRRRWII